MVDGCTSKEAIAETFRTCFQRNSEPNNSAKVEELNTKFSEKYAEYSQSHASNCTCHNYRITTNEVIDAICGMKTGKCADEAGIRAEHFHNAPVSLIRRLALLYNLMLKHSSVPGQFRYGYMIPLVKDSRGNHGDSSNYRGITISPISSKIFEHVLKVLFSEHLSSSPYQYGFEKGKSTTQCFPLHMAKTCLSPAFFINSYV